MPEDELKDFLMQRIAQLKSAEDQNFEQINSQRFKYRASTISNVLPSRDISEQNRLHENYKIRY